MIRPIALIALTLLAACKPPASDEYVARTEIAAPRNAPAEPIASPDTEGANWAQSPRTGRLLYGKPGEAPLLSLDCEAGTLVYRRYVAADPQAKAVLALIGNGHVARLWIDAAEEGEAWLWRGSLAADDPRLDVLTGRNRVEATVPGAGSVVINASSAPAEFINRCAASLAPAPTETTSPE